jgi:CheY-specific phosphatase CheX
LQTSLSQAATRTFEELALLVSCTPSPEVAAQPLATGVAVDFEGPQRGTLEVWVSAPVLPGLAANMLGEYDAPSPEMQRDALGEVANVICGNVLPAAFGSAAVFRLQAPRPVAGAPSAATASVAIGLDIGRAHVALRVTEAAAA